MLRNDIVFVLIQEELSLISDLKQKLKLYIYVKQLLGMLLASPNEFQILTSPA
jgi:hypothetical protein